ncbi:unnamed protein product [Penicillium nalgiovense]|nr:unnamed protein product [Penicillium nalgiovense]
MAIITTAVTGATLLSCSELLTLYKFYKLARSEKRMKILGVLEPPSLLICDKKCFRPEKRVV